MRGDRKLVLGFVAHHTVQRFSPGGEEPGGAWRDVDAEEKVGENAVHRAGASSTTGAFYPRLNREPVAFRPLPSGRKVLPPRGTRQTPRRRTCIHTRDDVLRA